MWTKPPLGVQLNSGHWAATGLVGAWIMNEASGSIARDLSGCGNDGTLASDVTWATGVDGPSLSFDSSTTAVVIGSDPSIVFESPRHITIYAVVDTTQSPTNADYIFGHSTEVILRVRNGIHVQMFLNSFTTNDNVEGATTTPIAERVHMAGTYDGINMKCFLNGLEDGSVVPTGSYGPAAGTVRIGGTSASVSSAYNGLIHALYLYERALSPGEIGMMYQDPYCMFRPQFDWGLITSAAAPPTGVPRSKVFGGLADRSPLIGGLVA